MDDIVIRVENLWKQYRYGTISHATLRKDLQSWWARIRGKPDPNLPIGSYLSPLPVDFSEEVDRFWALKDINFEVKRGEVLGIIGSNGAGKSTLLKIMSKVTAPTRGEIKIRGRVASLLEVGTGFHPELTGRENIFLNGAILGMTKDEIKRKFEEIVAFAEVENFIDTPVKRYSSGMYVRLAFAVAAHLEPEILVVDEVLAVGDAQFQKKCLGKMGEVAKEGRSILFVSHNMGAVKQLCTRAILLNMGRLVYEGYPNDTVNKYLQIFMENNLNSTEYKHVRGDRRAEITKLQINNCLNNEANVFIFEKVIISIDYVINDFIGQLEFFVLIYSSDGEAQLSFFQRDSGTLTTSKDANGNLKLTFINGLTPGRYFVSAGIFDKHKAFVDWIEHAESFVVERAFKDGGPYDNRLGRVSLLGEWVF